MNKNLTLLSFVVLVAFAGGIAYSHTDQSISQSISTTKALDRPHQVSEVTRASVKDSQGQYMGRITDVVLNPDGRISFAVFSQFGMNGRDEKLVAIPFNALSFNDDNDKKSYIVLDMTSEKLANAPLFNRSYLNARSWAEDSSRYFGVQPSWGEGREATLCENAAPAAGQISMTKGWTRPYEFTDLAGTPVRNLQGEEVGKIDDFVFDSEGRISFAIVGYGGFLGIGQNLVAVPVNSLSYGEDPRHFVLDTTKEKIQSAPLFSRKTLDDPNWANSVYRYFGQQPSWTKEK
jgi:sporulation protein YlmC with PRC-barrel domain